MPKPLPLLDPLASAAVCCPPLAASPLSAAEAQELAARLKAGFFRPRCTRLLIDALSSSAKIRAVMADLVAGTQPYRTLRRRLMATMEFRLAWSWWRSIQRTA